MRTILLLAFTIVSQTIHATDAYVVWATGKWGSSTVGNASAKTTTWGETADPDHDGWSNLFEYNADTDPRQFNPSSDFCQFTIPSSGELDTRFPKLYAWLRNDDPDLRVICQTSDNLMTWLPSSPLNLDQPAPANPYVWTEDTENVLRGLRQMHYIGVHSLADRPSAFMRLLITRRGQSIASPGADRFSFTSQPGVATGSTTRSSAIVLGGFAGNVTLNIPAGVTLYVNGIARTGSTAAVKAGGQSRHGLQPVNTSSGPSLSFYPATPARAKAQHYITDSGYTPVETGVSDTGAAQISIPIVVSPGTAGMQPKLTIGYSSQGGNGPLGVGFGLSSLSSISRVGRTVAQDGVKGSVNFDTNDRFALDGQRLIATSAV